MNHQIIVTIPREDMEATKKIKVSRSAMGDRFVKRSLKNNGTKDQPNREGYTSVWVDRFLCQSHPSVATSKAYKAGN